MVVGIYMGVVPNQASDLGYPDTGYELPELRVHEEIVMWTILRLELIVTVQVKMFREAALGLADAAKERRDNMQENDCPCGRDNQSPGKQGRPFPFMA